MQLGPFGKSNGGNDEIWIVALAKKNGGNLAYFACDINVWAEFIIQKKINS